MQIIPCTKDNFIETLEHYWNDNYKVEAESNPQKNRYIIKVQRISPVAQKGDE